LATLDVIQRERLMDNAGEIGTYLSRESIKAGVLSVQERFAARSPYAAARR
jgi:4-aminobutyrate aminotransferase-like enzyme